MGRQLPAALQPPAAVAVTMATVAGLLTDEPDREARGPAGSAGAVAGQTAA